MYLRINSASLIILFAFFVSQLIGVVHAAEPINTLEKKGFISYKSSGIAIRGADPVAYFTQNQYAPGLDAYTADWEGATWKFSSEENRQLFVENPEKYAPQYGGYCAYGVAQGSLVKIEPENWSIVDGKLYLNYNHSIQKKWEKDSLGFVATADKKFDALLAE